MGLDPFDCSVHLGDLAQPAILTIKNVQREVTYIRVAQVDGWQCRCAVGNAALRSTRQRAHQAGTLSVDLRSRLAFPLCGECA